MPPRQLLAFRIGCGAAFLTAALHMVGHLMGMQPTTPDETRVFAAASEVVLTLPGASRSLMDIQAGLSLSFSLCLALWGGLGLIVVKRGHADAPLMYAVARASAGAAVVMLVLSLNYWFLIPSVCIAFMAVSFAVASVRAPGS